MRRVKEIGLTFNEAGMERFGLTQTCWTSLPGEGMNDMLIRVVGRKNEELFPAQSPYDGEALSICDRDPVGAHGLKFTDVATVSFTWEH